MRILMVHNYHQHRGGDDEATEQEIQLLRSYGHDVEFYFRHNNDIQSFSWVRKALLFLEPTWSLKSYQDLKRIIQKFKPDVVHFQGFFPLVSPAAYYACREGGVPIVQTLHDYRLLCPVSTLFREGKPCEACVNRLPLPGVRYACYRDSRLQTASVALMLSVHHALGTWHKAVDRFITSSEFARQKFIQGGLSPSKIVVRPNFLAEDPGVGQMTRDYALFVGRLVPEKGLKTLLEAWRTLPEIPLKIVGEGPLRSWISEFIQAHGLRTVELVGAVPLTQVLEYQKRAKFLVMPSVLYETFGRTILEAYATGTPVIVSRFGAMAELVQEGKTGLLFNPNSSTDLAASIRSAISQPAQLAAWGNAARQFFEQKLSAQSAYEQGIDVYEQVMAAKTTTSWRK